MKPREFKTTMLDYFKALLKILQFDATLFKKEYRKSFQYLEPTERKELKSWLRQLSEGEHPK
ncbi:MAG: hypothetical protein U5K54_21710 [Cytophagales bacterium]|nr:hypothetical protein [Cytophagales bacterium]